ncbi:MULTISPECIES: flagellar hook-length control protein FliK [Halomonadaceae]|uniref:flagellar hook-length control protein FliK n=1 Tax=Halomonadaceae TaxID=28256 RepID=UPI00159856DB|nr:MULTISPECIES: flagellar hook-length control protein FliK [Halomonas]QJQ94400.1 hypothetical protein HIO72_03290 [Halomonas sp. PA5]
MDITTLLAMATSKAPSQSTQVGATLDTGFALALQQVAHQTARQGGPMPAAAGEATTASVDGAAVGPDSLELMPDEPEGAALPIALTPLAESIARAGNAVSKTDDLGRSAERQEAMPSSDASLSHEYELLRSAEEDQLAEIRERMALIAGAGLAPASSEMVTASQWGREASLQQLQGRAMPTAQLSDVPSTKAASISSGLSSGSYSLAGDELLLDPAQQRQGSGTAPREMAGNYRAADAQLNAAPMPSINAQGEVKLEATPIGGTQFSGRGDFNQQSATSVADTGLASAIPGASSAAQSTSPGVAGAPTAALAAPVASQPWGQQLGQQLVRLAQGGDQRVELRLNPAELGPLSITLKMSEQGAQAQFLSNHAHVRAAVEQAIPQLREALEEQGISLGETMVGEHSQGQQEQPSFARQSERSSNISSGTANGDADINDIGTHQTVDPLLEGRVDLYA